MKETKKNPAVKWKIISGVLAVLLITMSCLYVVNLTANNQQGAGHTATESIGEKASEDALSYWTDESKLKSQLTGYMAAITDEGSADYIPVESRVAVFDFDGTLFCETDPCYFDYRLLMYRVLDDPDYKDKASDFEIETAQKCQQYAQGETIEGLETDHGKSIASAFKGMTIDEFEAYVKEFREMSAPSYDGMKNGEGFYRPMLQVIDYLEKNDFTVYVISGTDRLIVRGIMDDNPLIDLPDSQIIGSDESLVATNQNGEDGLTYQFGHDDKLVTGGDFIIKNLKMNKVSVIAKEIGVQPVLSFGNSSGDNSMANYVITDNPYKSAAYMLCCDDLERENGNIEKAEKMVASCEENGWTPVSMKNDWTTIYGEGVTYQKAE